jgi:membrane protease YdiL (CAAX protease family)
VAGERLTSADKRVLLLWVLAGVIGAFVAYKYYFQAFPEASVNFQVSRDEALRRAETFVASMGQDVSGYESAIVFNVDDNAKTYLERVVGLKKANQIMSSQLNIWFWDVRFFKPQQEEEFKVRVSPAGTVVGYEHHVAEGQAGASPESAKALTIAQDYAAKKLGMDLTGWTLLEDETSSQQKPNRLDWKFTWQKRDFLASDPAHSAWDAPYRMAVELHGDSVGSSQEFLKVPEAWNRDYAQLRARNNFLTSAALPPYILILGLALWLSLALTRRGEARWSAAVKIGVLVTFLLFCMSLNEWPELRAGYDTNSSYAKFILEQLVRALLFGLGSAFTVTLVLPAADALYRVTQPSRLRINKAFTWRGLRSKEFFCASVVGLSLAAAALGFVVVFYTVGSKFGVWAPQDIDYTNSVSTLFPWISGVAIGLLAATNEEFTFRMFAIPLLQRWTGSRWLAVIIPAFCWSFLHTNYPQEPPYIRGVEIGIMGIVAGLVMLRWGILATLIWHYTYDAAQVGLLLVRSHNWYFRISGIVVGAAAAAPLIFAAVSYLQRGGFEADEDLLNRAEPAPDLSFRSAVAPAATVSGSRRYVALTPAMLVLLAFLAVGGAATVLHWKVPSIGDYLTLSTDARTAKARGDEILRAHGVHPERYLHSVVFVDNTDPLANEFLRERVGIEGANEIYASLVPGALWRIRYFRDSQKEEYAVILKPDGQLHSLWHVLPEDAPGATLSKDEAVALGEKYMREEKHLDTAQWTLVDADAQKQPHRVDHTLTWQRKQALTSPGPNAATPADQAYARIRIVILGNEVVRYQTFVKIPEEWSRQQQAETVPRFMLNWGAKALVFGALGLTMLVVLLRNLRSDAASAIPWGRLARWSAWAAVAFYVLFGLGSAIADLLNAYGTEQPLKLTLGGVGIGVLIIGPFYAASLTMLFGLAWFFAGRKFGQGGLPSWLGMPALYYRDALCIGIGGSAALLGLRRFVQLGLWHWPSPHRELGATMGDHFDATLPAAAIVASAILRGLFLTGALGALAAFVADRIPQTWLRALLVFCGAFAVVGGNWGNPADFAKQCAAELILLTVVYLAMRYLVQLNMLGVFLAAAAMTLVGGMSELLGQHVPFYQLNGYATVAALAILLAWPLLAWLWPRSAPAMSAS